MLMILLPAFFFISGLIVLAKGMSSFSFNQIGPEGEKFYVRVNSNN